MSRRRPWRLVASLPAPPGLPPVIISRRAFTSRRRARAAAERFTADGLRVQLWHVLQLPIGGETDAHPRDLLAP